MSIDSAFRLGLTTLPRLAGYVAGNGGPGRKGSALVRRLVGERLLDSGQAHSAAETILRRLILDSPLPRPELQHEVLDADGFVGRVDAAYPSRLLAVEAEGWEFHMGRLVWKNDRRRHNRLVAAGWTVLYFTYDELTEDSRRVIAQIAAVLEQRGGAPARKL